MTTMHEDWMKLGEAMHNLGRALRDALPSLIVFIVLIWLLMLATFLAFRLL